MDHGLEVTVRHRLPRLEISAELTAGRETLALVGPSGAGKTTILRSVAGLLRPDQGRVAVHGAVWLDSSAGVCLAPERRSVGFVFQDLALFPHLSVLRNVAYGVPRTVPRAHRVGRAAEVLARFGIEPLAAARPRSLSGGERQRVALARAVASDPDVLLLDEPLAALDPATRRRVGEELSRHLRELRLPSILVSHDFADVVGLADRVAVIEDGRIVQTGTAADLLQAPASPFVASLTGVNYFAGAAQARGELTEVGSSGGLARFLSTDRATGPVGVVIYPWEVALSTEPLDGSPRNTLAGRVSRVTGVGNRVRVTVASTPAIVAEVTDESIERLGIRPGVHVVASWKATGTRLVGGLAEEPQRTEVSNG